MNAILKTLALCCLLGGCAAPVIQAPDIEYLMLTHEQAQALRESQIEKFRANCAEIDKNSSSRCTAGRSADGNCHVFEGSRSLHMETEAAFERRRLMEQCAMLDDDVAHPCAALERTSRRSNPASYFPRQELEDRCKGSD